jgi:thiol-disulfide isomerase/thioredoxin/YHS domain-containing protein
MKNIFLALLAWALLITTSNLTWAQSISWQSDLEVAKTLAGQQNKLVLLHFSADWCHPCKSLESFVYTNSQVQRSMNSNVVPVKIDVDEFPNLAKEYGVANVPFDVAITPAGRVVYKRSSPRNASSYNDMINGFAKTIRALKNGNTALNQQLDELKDVLYSDNQIVEHPAFTPATTAITGPQPSFHSQELQRRGEQNRIAKIVNPYAVAETGKTAEAPIPTAEPKQINNDFVLPHRLASQENMVTRPTTNPADLLKQHQPLVAAASNPGASADATLVVTDWSHRASASNSLMSSSGNPDSIGSASRSNQFVSNPFSKKKMPIKIDTQAVNTDDRDQPGANQFEPAGAEKEAAQVGFAQSAEKSPSHDFDQGTHSRPGLHGKCPVTLLKEGRWVDGDARFGCVHRQRTYLFSNESNLQEFQADPDAFSPLLAGFDPVIYERTGKLVDGDVEHGVFMGKAPNHRVVLFASPETRTEFQAQPQNYIEKIRQAMQASGGNSPNIMR